MLLGDIDSPLEPTGQLIQIGPYYDPPLCHLTDTRAKMFSQNVLRNNQHHVTQRKVNTQSTTPGLASGLETSDQIELSEPNSRPPASKISSRKHGSLDNVGRTEEVSHGPRRFKVRDKKTDWLSRKGILGYSLGSVPGATGFAEAALLLGTILTEVKLLRP